MTAPPLVEPAADLSKAEIRRYGRHLTIPDIGMAGQRRLKNARVLCVGAGGLGSPALMYLAAAVRIPDSVLIPKGEIVSGAAIPQLPRDLRIVLYCKTGVRSAETLGVLRSAGFTNVWHLQGGVMAWIKIIDPSLPTY